MTSVWWRVIQGVVAIFLIIWLLRISGIDIFN